MGKYESMLRRTTQVEISVGLMRSRFETYPPQQFDLTDVLDTPITLGNHVVASGPVMNPLFLSPFFFLFIKLLILTFLSPAADRRKTFH